MLKIFKSIGKPYSQQPGRKQGKGKGKIKVDENVEKLLKEHEKIMSRFYNLRNYPNFMFFTKYYEKRLEQYLEEIIEHYQNVKKVYSSKIIESDLKEAEKYILENDIVVTKILGKIDLIMQKIHIAILKAGSLSYTDWNYRIGRNLKV